MKRKNLLKPVIVLTVVALAIAIPLLGGCRVAAPGVAPPEAEEAPTYTWKVTSVFPLAQTQGLVKPVLEELEEALGGRVDFELYGAGELMPDDQVLHSLQRGTIQFGIGNCRAWGSAIDLWDLDASVAFAWNSAMEQLTLFEERGLNELYAASYEDLGGIKWLGMAPCDPAHLMTTTPVTKYEDLAGMAIMAMGDTAPAFEEAGATMISLPWDEIYLGGQTGVIDGLCQSGATEGYTNSWHEVFPYFLDNPFAGGGMVHWVCSEELWDSLDSDMQAIIEQGAKIFTMKALTYYYDGEPQYRQYFTVTTMPDEDFAKLREDAMERWDDVAASSPRCAQVIEILRDYSAEVEAAEWWR